MNLRIQYLHYCEVRKVKNNDEIWKEHIRWYALCDYLEKESCGRLIVPWKLIPNHPDWCEEVLEKWKEQKAKGFKVP